MDNRYIVALELSGSQVKGAVATIDTSNEFSQYSKPVVEAIAVEDKVNCVQYGRVQNIIEAVSDVGLVVKKLENDPKLKNGKITAAYVGLSGRSMGSVHTTAELFLQPDTEITAEIVKQLEVEASKSLPDDKKPLRVVPRKFYVDNQVNSNPVGSIGSIFKGEFTVVTCNKHNQRNLDLVIATRLGIDVREYVITPLAVADLVLSQEDKQLGCMLVDLGAQTTTVSIYKDRALQYLATLPLGSANITHDIAIGLNITDERAELAKFQQGDATADTLAMDPNMDENALINCYVQARLGEIIANISAQIGYAGYKSADLPSGIIITGRGAKLRNIEKAITNMTKMKVRRANVPTSIVVSDHSIDTQDYVSLIAIVYQASKTIDVGGCVKMPKIEPVEQQQAVSTHNAITDDDDSDADWDLDDELSDKEKQRREQEQRKKAEKEQKRKAKAEAKAAAKEAGSRTSLLAKLRNKIYNLTVDEGEDASLDD